MRKADAPIKVLIVDDHEVVRHGLRALLEQTAHIRTVGETTTVGAALEAVRRLAPDVVLMERRLPDGSGIDACRSLRAASPGTQVLILTDSADDESIVSALRAGAAGFLLKSVAGQDLARAIEAIAKGQSIFDRTVVQRLMAHLCSLSVSTCGKMQAGLSVQERRVMELVVQGKTNKEIAGALDLSEKTVKNYLSHVYDKLHVSRRAQATVSFLQQTRAAGGPSIADLGCPLLSPASS